MSDEDSRPLFKLVLREHIRTSRAQALLEDAMTHPAPDGKGWYVFGDTADEIFACSE